MKLRSIPALLATSATVAALATAAIFAAQGSLAQAAAPHASAQSTQTTVVSTRHTSLGTILVGAKSRTLYLWQADRHGRSTCFAGCDAIWPPLMLTGKLTASGGVQSKLLGSVARPGGRQVTYAGHPLYYYTSDTHAGDTNGQGSESYGAEWDVLKTSGKGIAIPG